MTGIHPGLVPVPVLDVRIRNVGGVIHLGRRDLVLELADVAAFAWRAVDRERTIGQIATLVAAEYGVDRSTAAADLVDLFGDLAESGLLVLEPSPSTMPGAGA